MDRREFVKTTGMALAAMSVTGAGSVFVEASDATAWRTFRVTTRVEVLNATGAVRVWAPAALICDTPFQRTLSNEYAAEGGTAELVRDKADGLGIISAKFAEGVRPVLTVTSRVATRDYAVDFTRPRRVKTAPGELQHFLRPTRLIATDGIVKDTALEITKGAKSDVEKARAIYEWIVDNTFRNPKTRGCGVGDIRWMLESRDLGGKCADLNALYVGLARSVGLPARDVYGIRVAKSELGYKSLGASSEKISKAQHCRAEVYLKEFGWVPVDPADVRKVVLEEPPGNRALDDEMVRKARKRLFGSWEMNWMAYNFAHDVALPGSGSTPLGFLMYPQAETKDGRVDSLDAENFRYEITAKEVMQGA
jgi:transglutaminase-like putative cysteine protease